MIRLGVLGSTRGTDLQAILDAIQNDTLDAEVVVVVSNRNKSYILERARHHNIPCLLYTSPSPRDGLLSRMPSSA